MGPLYISKHCNAQRYKAIVAVCFINIEIKEENTRLKACPSLTLAFHTLAVIFTETVFIDDLELVENLL